ncbi:MAG: hypothetical protein D6744_16105 [Planctomycetota bacterium]|nr:MAG: hypothetical protein D6744_16105 [Planctomycetota bacterium]
MLLSLLSTRLSRVRLVLIVSGVWRVKPVFRVSRIGFPATGLRATFTPGQVAWTEDERMNAARIGRLIQRSNLGVVRAIESLLLSRADGPPIRMPLLAVCGAPRTGSTVTYQVLSQAFDCYYISNLQNVFFRTPLAGHIIARRVTKPYVSDYRSAGGFVAGLNGPAEAMNFWTYWCDHQLTECTPSPSERRLRRFGRVMNAIYRRDGRPFLAGYLPHAFYVDHLLELFPTCVIVRMNREMLDGAVSALRRWRVTEKENPADQFYYGTRTRDFLGRMSKIEYVARQQFFINRRMDELEDRHPEVFFHAYYSRLCESPAAFVDALDRFLQSRNIAIRRRTDTQLPESLKQSTYASDQDEDTRAVLAELDRLHAEYGPTRGVYRNASPRT